MSIELPPPINVNEANSDNKGFMAKLSKSARAATKLVALQAERTKLNTLVLPALYRALGKDCLQQKRHLDCVVALTSQLRSVLDEITNLAEVATGQPAPQSLTDKAKVAGRYALDTARQQQLGLKRDSLIANIGRAIYEKHSDVSGPIELVGPITSSIARIAQIDAEIDQQSQVGKGSITTPKRMLAGMGLIVALLAAYIIFPRNSRYSEWKAERAAEWGYTKETLSEIDLKRLSFDEICSRMGPPDEVYTSSWKPNVGLAIWKTGSNQYTVVSFIKTIDGSDETWVTTVHTERSMQIVNTMKKAVDNIR